MIKFTKEIKTERSPNFAPELQKIHQHMEVKIRKTLRGNSFEKIKEEEKHTRYKTNELRVSYMDENLDELLLD